MRASMENLDAVYMDDSPLPDPDYGPRMTDPWRQMLLSGSSPSNDGAGESGAGRAAAGGGAGEACPSPQERGKIVTAAAKRVRHVYDYDMLAHVWANKSQEVAHTRQQRMFSTAIRSTATTSHFMMVGTSKTSRDSRLSS
jgi:hypothetical protein